MYHRDMRQVGNPVNMGITIHLFSAGGNENLQPMNATDNELSAAVASRLEPRAHLVERRDRGRRHRNPYSTLTA